MRPGPIQGNMVHPYLRRRRGAARKASAGITRPSPEHGDKDELRGVLEKTLGVPLFQEQAMRIAIVAAGFKPGEADRLRRAMATFKRVGTIGTFRDKFIEGMIARGYDRDFADRLLRPDRRLRRIRLSRKPCGELRQSRLRLGLDQMPLPGRVRRGSAQQPADGLLRPGADRARRAGAWRRGAAGRRQSLRTGIARWSQAASPRERICMRATTAMQRAISQTDACAAARLAPDQRLFRRRAPEDRERARRGLRFRARSLAAHRPAAGSAGEARACRRLPFARPRPARCALGGRALRRAGDKDDLPLFARAAMPELEPDVASAADAAGPAGGRGLSPSRICR